MNDAKRVLEAAETKVLNNEVIISSLQMQLKEEEEQRTQTQNEVSNN